MVTRMSVFKLPDVNPVPANEKAKMVGNFPSNVANKNELSFTPETPEMRLTPAEGRIGTSRPIKTAKKPLD